MTLPRPCANQQRVLVFFNTNKSLKFLKLKLFIIFCCGLSFLYNCSGNKNSQDGKFLLESTDPEENTVISASSKSVSFVFDRIIYLADKAKITLNGASANASARGYTLLINLSDLEYNAAYTAIVEKGAIKDRENHVNQQVYSLSFRTDDKPVPPEVINSVSQNGFLSVKETSLVNDKGKPVILRGVSFGWHNWWPRFYNENTVAWLKDDWKCGVVRAAIGVEPTDGVGGYLKNPTFALDCLYAVVDAAIKNDMYVIVDWHSHSIKLEEAKAFFQLVAEKYKDYPNIIYEIFNEPQGISWGNIKAYSEAVIGTIRAIDRKNIILVGTPNWSQDVDVAAGNPITGYDNLMYVLHFYAATHGQSYRDKANTALQKGLPIFVSECAAMEATGNGQFNMKEWQTWLQWMNEHGISWATWSIADKDETCSMIKDTSSPVSGWKDSDLKEWGIIVREELRK